jgi:uncharacterized protein
MDNLPILEQLLGELYEREARRIPFHGWHHVDFVRRKSVEVAREIGADLLVVEPAALTHDLNRIVDPLSSPKDGEPLRRGLLEKAGYSGTQISKIEHTVCIDHRDTLTIEQQALSDGDTIFQALPVTPLLFTHLSLRESNISFEEVSKMIAGRVERMSAEGRYFYTEYARKKYGEWAARDLLLWRQVRESLGDPDVIALIEHARRAGVI